MTRICATCGVQGPGEDCPVCEDSRQWVPPGGQVWTTQAELGAGRRNVISEVAPGIWSIRTEPGFAIGQTAYLVQTAEGNVLWDCVSLLDKETEGRLRELGGVRAMAVSHCHYYATMADWSRVFGAPVYIHALDAGWVRERFERLVLWSGDSLAFFGGFSLVLAGGHFAGYQNGHWAVDGGVLFAGDQPQVCMDRRWVSFMYSYPNLIPFGVGEVEGILARLAPWEFDRIYGAFGRNVIGDAKGVVRRSAGRYLRALGAGGVAGTEATWLVSAGRDGRPGSPLNVPPVPASNFVLGERRAYSRDDGTPGWEALEAIVGGLEGGSSVAFASGMAGIAAVFEQLPVGAVVALPDDCYQGVAGLAAAGEGRGRWTVRRLAVTDTAGWTEMCGVADLIWLESPSNPLLAVADVDLICAAPRKPGAILAVDNTFATPLNQRPLALGADVSVQSVTKFIGGHSDLLGGVVTVREPRLLAAFHQARELGGATPGALEAFLAVRGARTLAVRLERAERNAMTLAARLARHPHVTLTRYPGLASHPTYEAARRQLRGFGTVLSFDVRGDAAAADAVCARVRVIQHATSLGAVESTMERRAGIPGQEHLPAALLRLSVGIEDVEDLWVDLDGALRGV